MLELMKRYRVQAAHRRPHAAADDPESRLHGHGFSVELWVRGPVDPHYGWVVDFGDMTAAFKPLFNQIDHHLLNEVEGLDDPSAENIARWVYERLQPTLPLLHRVVVVESEDERGSFPLES